jgi:glycyl-tRNA synthetase beta chain
VASTTALVGRRPARARARSAPATPDAAPAGGDDHRTSGSDAARQGESEQKLLPAGVIRPSKDGGATTAALLKKLVSRSRAGGRCLVEQLERASDGKAEYFVFRTTKPGRPLAELLPAIVAAAIAALPAPKLMRWGASDVQFIRPFQGLVMMHGATLIACELLEMKSTDRTLGHRFLGAGEVTISSADDYAVVMARDGHVMPAFAEREQSIREQLARAAGDARLADESLVEEVAALVEWPAVYEGHFDQAFLEVPQECLMLTMKANQKYFPLVDAGGKLLNRFLVVSNMQIDDPRHIIAGNERVLRARLADAKFFFDQDRRKKLADLVEPLGTVVFHNKLGTQLERAQRIERLAETIASLVGAEPSAARQAGHLCKADLMSGMVGEFPELQGTMGMYYARHDHQSDVVADAIEAHYRPRFAGDALPGTSIGDCVALADKLDTLAGIYGIGLAPTGDKDPFALRRAALGVLRILVEHQHPLDLTHLIAMARDGYAGRTLSATLVEDLSGFMLERLRSYLRDRGYAADAVDAVVAHGPQRVDLVVPRLEAVKLFGKLPEAASLAAANKRIGNILKKAPDAAEGSLDATLLVEAEERDLFEAMTALEPALAEQMKQSQFAEALRRLAGLRDQVDAFFDKVMVNADDPRVRANRLALLARLNRLMNQVADLSRLAA